MSGSPPLPAVMLPEPRRDQRRPEQQVGRPAQRQQRPRGGVQPPQVILLAPRPGLALDPAGGVEGGGQLAHRAGPEIAPHPPPADLARGREVTSAAVARLPTHRVPRLIVYVLVACAGPLTVHILPQPTRTHCSRKRGLALRAVGGRMRRLSGACNSPFRTSHFPAVDGSAGT